MSADPSLRQRALVALAGPASAYGLLLGTWLGPAVGAGPGGIAGTAAVVIVAPIVLILTVPVRSIGDRIEARIGPSLPAGRFHGAATDVSVALGEPARLLTDPSAAIDVVGLPTSRRDIAIVTAGAFEVLTRREVVALAAARFAALRDPWCRVATQGALAWWALRFIAPLGLIGFVAGAFPLGVAAAMILLLLVAAPRWPDEIRNRCADLAAIERSNDPGGLAGSVRRVSGLGRRADDLGVAPVASRRQAFLAIPRLAGGEMTTNVGFDKRRRRHIIHCLRLLEVAERRVGMTEPAELVPSTGRDLRRRWAHVGRPVTID